MVSILSMFVLLSNLFNGASSGFMDKGYNNQNCGQDSSPLSVVYEGAARIESYPWMGYLIYPTNRIRYTTVIVLVTKQVALATATEIDKLPKNNFRARARAVFGHNCSGESVPIREYSYHPDYEKTSYSALAMLQLETDHSTVKLHPICPPPKYFIKPQFFAMALSNDCQKPVVKLYEMEYVNPDECRTYYRKSGLDIASMWPTHAACARAVSGGGCVWRSGSVLALRQDNRWRLLGFGIYGPGCRAPARFLDYGAAHQWVRRSIANIGKPAITRIADNVVVLRRSLGSVQRFGPCDPEETQYELYQDETKVEVMGEMLPRTARYNVTVIAGIEYSCVVFRAQHTRGKVQPMLRLRRWCAGAKAMCQDMGFAEIEFYVEINFVYVMPRPQVPVIVGIEYSCVVFRAQHTRGKVQPKLRLRRWCAGAKAMCQDMGFAEIEFYVEITFVSSLKYSMKAYGQKGKAIDVRRAFKYINQYRKRP